MIVIVFGLPGSGKTFFARHFANTIKADYINSDKLRLALFANRTYTYKEKIDVYKEMLLQVREADAKNTSMVVDATFYKNETRKIFIDAAKDGKAIVFIEVRAEESLIRERLKKSREYSEADFEVYKKIKSEWEPMNEKHLILYSSNYNLDSMLKQAVSYVQRCF